MMIFDHSATHFCLVSKVSRIIYTRKEFKSLVRAITQMSLTLESQHPPIHPSDTWSSQCLFKCLRIVQRRLSSQAKTC